MPRVPIKPLLLIPLFAVAAGAARAALEGRPSAPQLRATLEEILASGYQLTPPLQLQLQEWLDYLARWLESLFGGLSESGPLAGLPPWTTWLIAGVCIAALILILLHMALTFRAVISDSKRRGAADLPKREFTDPRVLLRQAEVAFERQEYELALRLLYRAVLLRLDRRGLLPSDPARTNWENLRELRAGSGEVRAAMGHLTREFDACIYGGHAPEAADWTTARGWAEVLWDAEAAP